MILHTRVYPGKIRKAFKPAAGAAAKILVWLIIFFNSHIFKKSRNYLPSLLASLCFDKQLVFKINPHILKEHIFDPDVLPDNLFVWAGDWDRDKINIEDHEKIKLVNELLVEKKDYRDTEFYSLVKKSILEGEPLERGGIILDSEENIEIYFKKAKNLFEDITGNGFDINIASQIGIVIDRDGNVIHYRQGHHTLAIAKILGIKTVAARVRAVHRQWLDNQISGKGLSYLSAISDGIKKILQ